MNKKSICPNYCGVNCVNGDCPAAIFNSEVSDGVEPCDCENCPYYEGCADCCFSEGENICAIVDFP